MELLRFLLTCYGMFDVIIPYFAQRTFSHYRFWQSQRLMVRLKLHLEQPKDLKSLAIFPRKICRLLKQPSLTFFDLPSEIRQQIYEDVCEPLPDGSVPGALHLLILNKQIYREALPHFTNIPHTLILGDAQNHTTKPRSTDYGLPRLVRKFPLGAEPWHSSIKRLVMVISVWSIGTMTPDTFDVLVPTNSRPQWKALKSLIGIWPEVIDEPLEEIRLVLLESSNPGHGYQYRADVVRLIRNFKRTRIYAETGNCIEGNHSILLPLAKAFNQARRNWVKNATYDEHLLVKYDAQKLKPEVMKEWEEARKDLSTTESARVFDVVPTSDTSRTDDYEYPEWTDREEQYVRAKLVERGCCDYEWACRTCLAAFDSRRDLRRHRERSSSR